MKQLVYTLLLIVLVSGCSNKLTVKRHVDGIIREDIDTTRLNGFIRKNRLFKMDTDAYFFENRKRSIHYSRAFDGTVSYNIEIETNRYKDSFAVYKRNGRILGISRTLLNKSDTLRTAFYSYYANGINNYNYNLTSFKNLATNFQTVKVYTGKTYTFNQNGEVTYSRDYDKIALVSLNDLFKLFTNKIGESITGISVSYFDKQHDIKLWESFKTGFDYKLDYPYYWVYSKKVHNEKLPDIYFRIIDGKTDAVLRTSIVNINHVE